MTTEQFKKLYKLDSNGNTRVWWMEIVGDAYRTVSGTLDGKMVESDFRIAKPKNVGRSNATTSEQQARLEVESKYENKLTHEKYTDDINKIQETLDEGYFEPMLAEKWNDSKDKRVGWKHTEKAFAAGIRIFVQPKLDGYRAAGQSIGLTTRNGEFYKTVPHIIDAIAKFLNISPHDILDGELYNHVYHDNFNAIQKMIAPGATPTPERLEITEQWVKYYVYDVVQAAALELKYSERYERLLGMKEAGVFDDRIVIVEAFEVKSVDEIMDYYNRFLDEGYEGLMVRMDTPYENRRTKNLIKIKPEEDEEYTILEVHEGEGNWSGKAKMATFKTKDGLEFRATFKGSMEENRARWADRKNLIGVPATIAFPNKTPDGKPRFGRITKLWPEKKF